MIVAGVMSGTSLDGIDAVAVDFADDGGMRVVGQASLPMPSALRSELLALALGTDHEIERMGDASVALAHLYAWTLQDLQQRLSEPIAAAGVHGQTIRHRPNAALRCSSITLHSLLNSPALTSLPTSVHAMLPPAAKAHRSCRPFMLPAFAAPSAVQQYSISAASLTSH